MADRQTAKAALDRAEEEKNLLLVYQPIHDARTREVVSAEALLRQRRRSGEIREAHLIAKAAERGPELFALDSWALRTAFEDAASWPITINVNLSPREFETGEIVPRLERLMGGAKIDPHHVHLEITETSYVRKPKETTDTLEELKNLGVGLWLDDFGTGHSSITHLLHFPIDGLKLPGTFIERMTGDHRARSIVHSLIVLAHELNMKVIAEGVEKEEQLRVLLDWDCDFVQGFLFSEPMTAEEMSVRRSSSRASLLPARNGRGARRDPSSRPS